MAWCERNRVDFVFGLARNARLAEELAVDLAWAEEEAARTGRSARRFRDFRWSTLDSWSRRRRVVGKAEWTRGEANPRFIVTSLKPRECDARILYERIYCARGDMENRIKECQLDLFAGRASAATMRANQLRLWFASMAYVLLCALRRIGLAHTHFAEATCGSIRLGLLKTGALVRISVRRIKLANGLGAPLPGRVRPGPCETDRRRRHGLTNQKPRAAISPDNAARHPATLPRAFHEPDPPSARPRPPKCCARPPTTTSGQALVRNPG
jgi:hypothetical protein